MARKLKYDILNRPYYDRVVKKRSSKLVDSAMEAKADEDEKDEDDEDDSKQEQRTGVHKRR